MSLQSQVDPEGELRPSTSAFPFLKLFRVSGSVGRDNPQCHRPGVLSPPPDTHEGPGKRQGMAVGLGQWTLLERGVPRLQASP